MPLLPQLTNPVAESFKCGMLRRLAGLPGHGPNARVLHLCEPRPIGCYLFDLESRAGMAGPWEFTIAKPRTSRRQESHRRIEPRPTAGGRRGHIINPFPRLGAEEAPLLPVDANAAANHIEGVYAAPAKLSPRNE